MACESVLLRCRLCSLWLDTLRLSSTIGCGWGEVQIKLSRKNCCGATNDTTLWVLATSTVDIPACKLPDCSYCICIALVEMATGVGFDGTIESHGREVSELFPSMCKRNLQ